VRLQRFGVAAGAAAALIVTSGAGAAAPVSDWSAYLHGARHSSFNAGDAAIRPANADSLAVRWTWRPPQATQSGQPAAGLQASPVVSGGRVFIGSTTGVFYALDERTGKVAWKRNLGFLKARTCGARGITSTAAVDSGTVYVADATGHLDALNAATGRVQWRSVIALPSRTVSDYYDWSSPTVTHGKIYIGVSSDCDKPLVRASVKAYRASDGALLATHFTEPKGQIGASVWTSVASDGTSVWATTGNGDETQATDHGDANSIVRLNGATLALQEKYTVPGIQQIDDDFGGSPVFFDDARNRQLIGACNKNGIFYAWQANDLAAGPVWQRRIGTAAGTNQGDFCLAAAVWDNARLTIASNSTTINGKSFKSSIRRLDPTTGRIIWQRGFGAGPIWGTPSENASGVIAAMTFDSSAPGANRLYLVNAQNGAVLASRPTNDVAFAQPAFADGYLFTATKGVLTALSP
jgi:outer membrane protein assembly factor BamB